MTQDEIQYIIRSGESETVEFKPNFNNEVLETVAAFSTTRGGAILIGISNSGEIQGVTLGVESLRDWVNAVSDVTEPKIIPDIESHHMEQGDVVVVTVSESPIKPVSARGRSYKRVGNSNRVMTPQEIAEMSYRSIGSSWDRIPTEAKVDDIDLNKVSEYVIQANKTGRKKIPENESPLETLTKLELTKENRPIRAAILLFGKDPQRKFSQAVIHCGRFKESTVIIDDQMIHGSVIDQIDRAEDFVKKNTNVRFEFTGEPARKEVWDYPLKAIREAIINSVCHRDYTFPSNTEIRIYEDRLTIWNPGGLPAGITLEDLHKSHRSVLRNTGIGAIFHDLGFIEKWGSGIDRMKEACKDSDLPEPAFEEYQNGFQVTFRKDIYTEEYLRKQDLNERQIKAVLFTKEKGKITNKQYQELFRVSKPTATNDLKELVEKKILLRIGITGKGTSYALVKGKD